MYEEGSKAVPSPKALPYHETFDAAMSHLDNAICKLEGIIESFSGNSSGRGDTPESPCRTLHSFLVDGANDIELYTKRIHGATDALSEMTGINQLL